MKKAKERKGNTVFLKPGLMWKKVFEVSKQALPLSFYWLSNTWCYRNTTNLFPHFKVHNAFYLLMQYLFNLNITTKNSRARYSPKNSRVLETAISHRHETRLLYNTGPQASATTTISKRHQAFLQLLNIVLHLGVNNQNTFFNLCKETTATRESQGNIWLSLVIL